MRGVGVLMLSKALDWQNEAGANVWVCKDSAEWESETGMSHEEWQAALMQLRSTAFWEEKEQRHPDCLCFRVNFERLAQTFGYLGRESYE